MHPVLCTNTHHDVTDLVNHGMVMEETALWLNVGGWGEEGGHLFKKARCGRNRRDVAGSIGLKEMFSTCNCILWIRQTTNK